MKTIFKIALATAHIFACLLVRAQTIKPLHIGDKVPDMVFAKMLNHTSPSGKLSDFKGKAIIIDMWFKECGGCIAAMPHLDSLQKEFNDDLQILLVTWQKQTEIQDFWRRNLDVGKYKFVQAVEDSLTLKFFPAVSFPHQIWISKDGIVTAITDGRDATRANIERLISNDKINLKEKKDELDANVSWGIAPLMNIRYEENKSKLLNYAYFSKYRPELNGGFTYEIDTANKLVRVKFSNQNYIDLYHYAYASEIRLSMHRPTRVARLDHTTLPIKLDFKNYTTSFCYDLIYKDSTGTIDNFGKYMVADLDRFFNVKSHEEIRKILCYVISPNGKGTRFRTTIDPEGKRHLYNSGLKKKQLLSVSKHWPAHVEANLMFYVDKPLLFEMGNERIFNFEVVWNLDDLKQMNVELAKYDLKIEMVKRKRKVIILEDPK